LEKIGGVWSADGEILNLLGWRTLKYKEFEHDLIICAELTTEPEQACRRCGAPASEFGLHGHTDAICVYDLPIRYKRTRIYCKLQRFICTACDKTTQQPTTGLDERHQMTRRLVKYIEKESFNISKTFSALADEIGVSIQLIRNMFTDRTLHLEKIRRIETPEWLAMDEVYIKRKAHCVTTDPVRRRVVDILKGNKQGVIETWLLQLPNRSSVKMVTIDMWNVYLGAIRRLLPQAAIVVDRYHVHNLLNCAIKDVLSLLRKGMSESEQRKYMRDPRLLFKSRYKLSIEPKRDEDGRLKMPEKQIVEKWLKDMPEIETAYRLKEDFSDILQMDDRQKAEAEVDLWLERVSEFAKTFRLQGKKKASGKDDIPFSNVLREVKIWREYILNYIDYKKRFRLKPTNGFAESVNGQIKRALRLGNGYNYEVIRSKAIHRGVFVKLRPRLALDKGVPRTRHSRARRRQGLFPPEINPNANVVRLERVRESMDETKGLLPDPKSNEAWAKRFKRLPQDAPCSVPDTVNFPTGIAERGLNSTEKRKKRSPRRSAAKNNGEVTWSNQLKTRFAFGTTETPKKRRDFTPRPFPTHLSAQCTAPRETFLRVRKGMC
jgi:transposase